MSYGQKLSQLRKRAGLTQAELGEKLNISPQAVSKWENDLSEPDIASLKKLSEIFGISLDLLLSEQVEQDFEQENNVAVEPKIINGYCEKCKKPVGPNEYEVSNFKLQSETDTIVISSDSIQHVYCNECFATVKSIFETQEKQKAELQAKKAKEEQAHKKNLELTENKRSFIKGFIWGSIALVIAAIISFGVYLSQPDTALLISAIVMTVGAFTFISQVLWDSWIFDFFLFFCRSFTAPFGFVFELSLDGILWLITVKLFLWILFGILSILFFLCGIVLSFTLSIIIFPFGVTAKAKSLK